MNEHPVESVSAVETAVRFVSQNIDDGRWPYGSRIPTIEELGRMAGVSRVTMWKAVRSLADKGILRVRRRAGTYVGRPSPNQLPSQTPLAESVSGQLLSDILEGRFHTDRILPSLKELTHIYQVGYRAVRAAIDRLVSEGHIREQGHRLIIDRKTSLRSAGQSLFLVTGDDFLTRSENSYWRSTGEQFLHYFEQQCAIRNVRLDRATADDGYRFPLSSMRDSLGVVFWVTGSVTRRMEDILSYLARIGKPAVIFDHGGEGFDPVPWLPRGVFRLFRIGGEHSGKAVGNTLLHLGHRSVCYVVEKREPWSEARYQGLADAFSQAGYPDAVGWFSGAGERDQLLTEGKGAAIEESRFVESLRSQVLSGPLDDPYRGRLVARLEEASYWRLIYQSMEPAMEQATRRKDATAWVAGDDYAGLYAVLPFLKSRRVRVPRDLSVVSFNNQFESAHAGLTSYQFDMTGMAMRMLTFLLYPSLDRRLRPGRQSPSVEEVGGFVVDRGSVGKRQ